MDAILGGLKKSASESNKQDHQSSSPSDLLSNAKAVAEAAQSALRNETDKVDKAKVADAAEELLDSASKYGKLEGTPVGQYVEKAETYLHQYHSSQPSTTTAATPSEPPTTTSKPPSEPDQKGEEKSGSGVGDYVKMAQGFLNK